MNSNTMSISTVPSTLHIYHRLQYRYDEPVLLGPQRLNLWPRLGQHQRLLDYQLTVFPEPSGLYSELDVEGNHTQWAYFNQATQQLEVVLKMTIGCQLFDPLHFVIFPFEAAELPFEYSGPLAQLLDRYKGPASQEGAVAEWALALREEAAGGTVAFLDLLCRRIYEGFSYVVREEGPPLAPVDTFLSCRGSCRDLSMLMVAACQSVGLAARFVSGYAWAERESEKNELHAWVEVYLPGAGWRAFDPTQGSVISSYHVAMAASAYPERTAPMRGTYSGTARSQLETEVDLKMG